MSIREDNLDERQKTELLKVGNRSYKVMMTVCILCLFGGLFWEKLGGLLSLDIVLLSGSITYLAGCVKAGIWSTNNKLTGMKGVLFYSCTFSVISTLIFWAILIMGREPGDPPVNQKAAAFFGIIFVSMFVITFAGNYICEAVKKRNEKKYSD